MGPLERWLRRAVNPVSTALTEWWCGVGPRRQVPQRPASSGRGIGTGGRPRAFLGVASPGEWVAPAGLRPGWQWLPEHGATPRLWAVPHWVRIWYRTPFLDRYAYEWMWWHGGWSVLTPGEPPPGGVREPLRPFPLDRPGASTSANDSLVCSFCGKSRGEVERLIAGPGAYICDECVGLCNEIIDGEWASTR